jgi:hypothetical protein
VTKTLTAEEVLSGRKAAIANLAKNAATYFGGCRKSANSSRRASM